MRFAVPRRPHPVAVHVDLRAQVDAKMEKERARRRLEDLEARAEMIADYESADQAFRPRRRADD